MRWTKAWRRSHGKELMFDKSLEFEKRRMEPVRYNRDLYVKTVQAMKKIEGIRARREKAFIENRIKQAKKNNREVIERELMKHVELIKNKDLKTELKKKKVEIWEKENAKIVHQSRLQRELQKNKNMDLEGDPERENARSSDSEDDMDEEEIAN